VSDRSDELRRQREIVRQHLAWLDRELASREGIPAPEPLPNVAQDYPSVPPRYPSVSASDADRDAESILDEFRQPAPSIEAQTKRGCILYFAIGVGLLLAVVIATVYFYSRGRH
jgi:hypothetical protein